MRLDSLNLTPNIRFAAFLLSTLFNNVENIVIFGGYIRDSILNQLSRRYLKVYDLDVVISNPHLSKDWTISRNRFYGNTVFEHNIRVDFWELKNTYSLIKNNKSISIDELPETTVFNCNSIAYNIRTHKIYECGFLKSLETRTIDFNDISYLYDFQELQAIRSYYLAKKLKYKLSPDVKDFLYTTLLHTTYFNISKKLRNSKYDNFYLIWEIYKNLFTSKRYHSSYCNKCIINRFFMV